MLIFCSAPEQPEDVTGEVEYDPENPPINYDESKDGVNITAVDPAEEEESAVEATVAPKEKIDESTPDKSNPSDLPSDSNMDDLD